MANPQKEDGYTPIANAIMEKLASAELSGREFRILFVVLRKTWGWSKKSDRISMGQISAITGIARPHVAGLVSRLEKRGYLKRDSTGNGNTLRRYTFVKNYDTWDIHTLSTGVTEKGNRVLPKTVTKVLPKTVHTKATKQLLQKKGETHVYKHGDNPRSQGMRSVGDILKKP